MNKKINFNKVIVVVLILINMFVLFGNTYNIHVLTQKIEAAEQTIKDQRDLNKKMVDTLGNVSDVMTKNNSRINEQEQMLLEVKEAKKKQFKIDKNTDLCDQVELSVADMNKIIDGWDSVVKNGTAFKGRGAAFIEAARETGLNPVYILAHAAYESGWGKSAIAKEKANFFGINATDTETYNNAYEMGDSIDKGIIEGAKWVKQNYYDEGQTSLYSMIHGGKTYASAQDRWVSNIVSIVNTSYKML